MNGARAFSDRCSQLLLPSAGLRNGEGAEGLVTGFGVENSLDDLRRVKRRAYDQYISGIHLLM